MGCDSVAYLKEFVEPKCIYDYIRNNIDHNIICDGTKWETICSLDSIKFDDYKKSQMPIIFAKSPEDFKNWRILSGWIYFNMHNKDWPMFYYYSPLHSRDGYDDCNDKNILEIINSDTTCLRMPFCRESINILTNIVKYFGGGWIDDNDCDNEDFYKIK